jgi:opacity protein-like surface antigen
VLFAPEQKSSKIRSPCLRAAGLGITACTALLGTPIGQAVEYRLEGDVAVGQQFSSNIILSRPPQAVWGTNLDLNAALAASEPNWQVTGKTRLSNYFYTPVSGIDMQNQYLDVRSIYMTERSRYQLSGNFTDDSFLSSQNDQIVGLVVGKVHRNLKSLNPVWFYSLSETSQLSLGYQYNRAEYDASADNFPNSDTHTAFSQLEHRFSERLSLSGEVSYSAYDAKQRSVGYQNRINFVNFSLGLKYAFDPTLDIQFSAGGQYSRTEAQFVRNQILGFTLISLNPIRFAPIVGPVVIHTPPADSLGPVFNLEVNKRFDRTEMSLFYNRQISPSISGDLLEVDRAGLSAKREFRFGLSGSLGLSYTHQTFPSQANQTASFSFYQATGEISYAWTEHWSASASYRYFLRQIDNSNTPNEDSNSVLLTLRYNFDTQKF